MGVYYGAEVFCGFRLSLVRTKGKRTKYNEDTGAPYEVEADHGFRLFINGKPVLDSITDDDDLNPGGDTYEGLDLSQSGVDGTGEYFLGKSLAATGFNDDLLYYEFKPIVPDAVKEFANRHDLEPQWFLIADIST